MYFLQYIETLENIYNKKLNFIQSLVIEKLLQKSGSHGNERKKSNDQSVSQSTTTFYKERYEKKGQKRRAYREKDVESRVSSLLFNYCAQL